MTTGITKSKSDREIQELDELVLAVDATENPRIADAVLEKCKDWNRERNREVDDGQ